MNDLIGKSVDSLTDDAALNHIGLLIDAASAAHSAAGTDRAFILLDEIRQRDLAPEHAVLTHYFAANAWDIRKPERTDENVWLWEQPEVQAQILELRRAVQHEGFERLQRLRRCQILTNLANQLDHVGRFIEAVELWDRALAEVGNFAMALGNRGISLSAYAHALYDPGHAGALRGMAHQSLQAATAPAAVYESAGYESIRSHFEHEKERIARQVDVKLACKTVNSRRYSLGRTAAERVYRKWCLENRLFVNPLNDLGSLPIAAQDVLTLPDLSVPTSVGGCVPPAIGFFNQMKQEFISARFFYYEGLHAQKPHYSDRGVLLYNTLDYPAYSFAVEKQRAAFRIAYSVLDKVGFFLNSYLAIGHNSNRVSFRNLWFENKGSKPYPLLSQFSACDNWPLRGLFWLSKDLFEEEFQLVTEPDAQALNEIRNHLEHKYLQVHEDFSGIADLSENIQGDSSSRLGYFASRDDFSAKTLRILKLARAALIYLSLAVHREEARRSAGREAGFAMPIPLDTWKDAWKQ